MKKLLICFAAFSIHASDIPDRFIDAIWAVESNRSKVPIYGDLCPKTHVYKAIGPLQIHKELWQDSIEFCPKIGGSYSDCQSLSYSKKIMIAYLNRYSRKHDYNLDKMAKIWNGGCGANSAKSPMKVALLNKYLTRFHRALNSDS